MSFRVTLHSVPRVHSYEDAVAFHNKAAEKPWRNGAKTPAHDDFALPGKRVRHMGVRKQGENIIFRLYNTDVVTWRSDGSVRVETYNSRSTFAFIERFTAGFWINSHNNGFILRLHDDDHSVLPVVWDFTYFPDGTVGETEVAHFFVKRINREQAKRVRDTVRYGAFTKWRKIMEPLLAQHRDWRERWKHEGEVYSIGLPQCVMNEEHWPLLVNAQMANTTILANLYDREPSVHEFERVDNVKWRKDGRYVNLSRYRIMRSA